MDVTTIDLVSDDETPLLQRIKDSPGKCVKNNSLDKEVDNEKIDEMKQSIKTEVEETKTRKRPKKEQLASPNKRAKLEPGKKGTRKKLEVKSEVGGNVTLKEENPFALVGECSKVESKLQFGVEWQVENVIAEKLDLPPVIVRNTVRLFEADNTIPFIARYRKEQTGNMEPETLRRVKDNYERLLLVKSKMDSVASSITKMNKMTSSVLAALRSSRTLNEIEHIYAQFRPSGARTLAEKARALGLEKPAMAILEGTCDINPLNLVNKETESITKVMQGLQHIIADVISKNKVVLDTLRELYEKNKNAISVESKRTKSSEKVDGNKTAGQNKGKKAASTSKATKVVDEYTAEKFQLYFSFTCRLGNIKPHQVLAILRGESLKVLSVKINTPDWFLFRVKDACHREWLCRGYGFPSRTNMMEKSIEDAYTRLMQPYIVRQIRNDLMEEAHLASIEVFARNLKHLLLIPPLRGKVVMGIDPGYKHGCKLAVVNNNGDVLKTDVMYIHSGYERERWKHLICSLCTEHRCEFIALGNGTACRETEVWLGSLISGGCFKPLDVKYTIVDEQGVSIYSCSPIAKQEFPDMDPNVISAISLARRVQDPLSELVKVEPKHLGVGMYQHDIPEKKLSSTLDEVVIECVSFVGVDVNTASGTLLRHVSGLNASRASNIIDWRTENGPFMNRDQLHLVKGVGPKSFEQCAGFLRIMSETSAFVCFGDLKTSKSKSKSTKKNVLASENSPNPLDRTWIHPESYATVYWLLEFCGVTLADFGTEMFVNRIQSTVNEKGFSSVATTADISEARLKLIIEGLKQKPDYDIRSQFHKPLFRSSLCSVNDLKVGSILTGRVQNVTHFGAFIDCGVGQDGLLHISQMRNVTLEVGTRVEVKIRNIELGTKKAKISLGLERVL